MHHRATEAAENFAAVLDRRQYRKLVDLLSPSCQYRFRQTVVQGSAEIVETYRQSTEWGFDVFDRIDFESAVSPESENSARVTFTDRLFHRDEVHVHTCQQILSVDERGLIDQIVHVDLEGEGPALDAFLARCGVARP